MRVRYQKDATKKNTSGLRLSKFYLNITLIFLLSQTHLHIALTELILPTRNHLIGFVDSFCASKPYAF